MYLLKPQRLQACDSPFAEPKWLSQIGSADSECGIAKSFVLLHRAIEHRTKPEFDVIPISDMLSKVNKDDRDDCTFCLF